MTLDNLTNETYETNRGRNSEAAVLPVNSPYFELVEKIENSLRPLESALLPIKVGLLLVPIFGFAAYLGGRFLTNAISGRNEDGQKLSIKEMLSYGTVGAGLLVVDISLAYTVLESSINAL